MQNFKKHILVVSYFAGQKGFSPAEWLDDKIHTLLQLNYDVTLISCLSSIKFNDQINHVRVPSFSLNDFKLELNELKSTGQNVPLYIYLYSIIPFTLGWLFDKFFILITKGLGGGRLSWALTSFWVVLFYALNPKFKIIFSTGGAASSHISASLCGFILRKKVVIELQDPLCGHGIGRTSKSAQFLYYLEKFIITFADKIVYVTKQAAIESQKRHNTLKAVCIYPGARDFEIQIKPENKPKDKVRLLHLGTLYSTRNMNTLVQAIDELIIEKQIKESEIELINLGEIYGEYKEEYLKRSYFIQMPIRARRDAIAFAHESDLNLIIQHTDPRSTTTIPYKTYDYFNIPKDILGLTNNEELSELLIKNNHYSVNINNVSGIKEFLLNYLINRRTNNKKNYQKPFEMKMQVIHLLKF